MDTPPTSARTDKGIRGFDLDLHVTFARPLSREEALSVLRVAEGLTVDLYAPRNQPDGLVPSARLTGPLRDAEMVRACLAAWLQSEGAGGRGGAARLSALLHRADRLDALAAEPDPAARPCWAGDL